MEKFTVLTSKVAVLPNINIDTDQIIASDFLKVTTKDGLGENLFAAWRYLENGDENPNFVLNKAETRDAKILVAGDNFGCGSSREHAPWSLVDFGLRVVLSTSIADIFRNNSLKNGFLPIIVSEEFHKELLELNAQEITIDLENQIVKTAKTEFKFDVDQFMKFCMVNGTNELDFILKKLPEIKAFEAEVGK